MTKIDRIDHRVKEYLEDAGYEKWSRVYATVCRGRMMTSNMQNVSMVVLLKHAN